MKVLILFRKAECVFLLGRSFRNLKLRKSVPGKAWVACWLALASMLALLATADAARADPGLREQVCGMIERAAAAHSLPVSFLTRLIWQESAFRSQAVSSKGAQGIAQFMPGTAAERGLSDPFDPEQAIPKAAELLADLRKRFGNLGLAAAAYNSGATRVAAWLAGTGGLPAETRNYVELITGHDAEDWQDGAKAAEAIKLAGGTCLEVAGRIVRDEPRRFAGSALMAPWGVQVAGAFNRGAAMAAYARARRGMGGLLGEPMILGRRAPGRGFARFWAIRAPAPSRAAAEALCARIHGAGGACAVLKT